MKNPLKQVYFVSSHLTALAALAAVTYRLWSNLRFLSWTQKRIQANRLTSIPRVSVLVPARNEERTITSCVTSLMHQQYKNVEVIVLNDYSSDSTAAQLNNLSIYYPQLKVIHSAENLPSGWNGKSYACHRLAQQASGEWLLFTDADTVHTPRSISQGIAYADAHNLDLLSVFPYQETQHWSEQVLVSFIVDFLPLIGIDLKSILQSNSRTVANGQYLLIHAAAYRAVGGHEAISNAMVDDFALTKLLQIHGYHTAFLDGTDMLRCRMYTGTASVWNGFIKNILLALTTSSSTKANRIKSVVFGWGYASLFITPYILLVADRRKKLAALEIAWLFILRSITNIYLRRPAKEAITTPLAALSVMCLGIAALYHRLQNQKIEWKGRFYTA